MGEIVIVVLIVALLGGFAVYSLVKESTGKDGCSGCACASGKTSECKDCPSGEKDTDKNC